MTSWIESSDSGLIDAIDYGTVRHLNKPDRTFCTLAGALCTFATLDAALGNVCLVTQFASHRVKPTYERIQSNACCADCVWGDEYDGKSKVHSVNPANRQRRRTGKIQLVFRHLVDESFSRPLIRRASVTSFSHPPQHANQHANQIFRHSHGEHSTRTSSIKTRLRACVRPYCLVLIIFQCAQSGTQRRPAAGIPNWATCPHARQATGVLIKLSVSIGAHVHAAHAQGE